MMKIKIGKNCVMMVLLFSFVISSCGNPLITQIVEPKTVTFESNGGSRVESQTVFKDQPVKRPANPTKSGFTFAAWFRDNNTFLQAWDFAAVPTGNITLYAKWNPVTEPPPAAEIITTVAVTVTGPVKNEIPDTAASGTGHFSVGPVMWTPGDNPFQGGAVYTASVILTAYENYTFASTLTSATINGNDAAVTANTGNALTLSYTFAPTDPRTLTAIAIKTPPVKLVYTHGDTLDLSGLEVMLTFDTNETEDVAPGGFALRNISTIPAHDAVLSRSANNNRPIVVHYGNETASTNNLTVNAKVTTFAVDPIPAQEYTGGGPIAPTVTVRDGTTILTLTADYTVSYNNNINVGTNATVTITGAGNYEGSTGGASFTINKASITHVAVQVTAPEKNDTPATAASGTGNFNIGAASWSLGDDLVDNRFLGGAVYTVSVTLTAHENYVFASTLTSATINGNGAAVTPHTGSTLTLSYTFAATETRTVIGIIITAQPDKLTYTHGDSLELSGLVVKLTFDTEETGNFALADFASGNISAKPPNGEPLSFLAHNGPVEVHYGGKTVNTAPLTVSRKALTITEAAHTKPYDGGTSATDVTVTLIGVVEGDDVSAGTVTAAYISANAGTNTITITDVALTGEAAENYTVTPPSGNITVTGGITKANPNVTWPTGFTATYASGQTLAAVTIPNNGTSDTPGTFTWTTLANPVGDAGDRTHNMTFTPNDTANYNTPLTENVTFTVNKADGATVSAPTAAENGIGVNSITLNAIIILNQEVEYAYNTTNETPSTDWKLERTFTGLNAGTGYYFFARSRENGNYDTGAASSGTPITTMQNIDITVTVSELIEKAPTGFDSGIILYRNGSPQEKGVEITGNYYSISWEIFGPGGSVTGTTSLIPLSVENVIYNSPGYHTVTVTVTVTEGDTPYQTSFRFRIVE